MAVVPERFVFPASTVPIPGQPIDGGGGNVGDGGSPSLTPDYIQGKIDALQELLNSMGPLAGKAHVPAVAAAQPFQDDPQSTWGLKAITLGLRGKHGTGDQSRHPRHRNRPESPGFLGTTEPGEPPGVRRRGPVSNAQDTNGHGTHVAGTACGSQVGIPNPFQGRRYGVAPGAELFIGRVFPNATDQGHEIPPTFLAVIFEPFRREVRDRDRSPHGLGLGLYIVEQIVLAHRGSIQVESTTENGTTFVMRLPRTSVEMPSWLAPSPDALERRDVAVAKT